jgi:hypothetical protein
MLSPTEIRPNTAVISPCGVYRYELRRELGGDRPLVAIGLNPSVADAEIDDPTIRKDIGFAKIWQCGRVVKGNANAYRATDPKDMKRARKSGIDIVGPENDRYLDSMIALVKTCNGILLVAWGNHICPGRQAEISYMIDGHNVVPYCLGTNDNGTPKHELYIPYARELVPWSCP